MPILCCYFQSSLAHKYLVLYCCLDFTNILNPIDLNMANMP